MSVTNGQLANQTTFNNAFMSRTVNTSTTGKIALNNADSTPVVDQQAFTQEIALAVGLTEGGGEATDYTDENFITSGNSHKTAIDKLDIQLGTTQADLDIVESATTSHEGRISTLEANNTHDVTIGNFGSTPNVKGMSVSSQAINLQPADASNPGAISTGAQDIPGAKTFKSNVTIEGDLIVGGTTTTVNATNLEVADKNILVNNGGNDASSNGAGLDVERTSDNGAIRFDSTMTSKWKLGLVSAMYEILVSGIAQTVTGLKTFSSGIDVATQKITNLLAGTALTDAVNKTQLDANGGVLRTTTAGTSLVLTDTSVQTHIFTGSANHTVLLPSATTMVQGKKYRIVNWSSGIIFVQNSTGSGLVSLITNQIYEAVVRDVAGNLYDGIVLPAFSGNTYLDLANKLISNLLDPVGAQDAATKNYVDTHSGGGGGAVNLITNGNADNAVATIFTAYKDAAAARPVDGTGGSPVYMSSNITSTAPIKGAKSFTISRTANNAQGEGVAVLLDTLTSGYFARAMTVNIEAIVSSGTFQAGSSTQDSDIVWFLYDVTNGVLVDQVAIKMLSNSSSIGSRVSATFQTSANGTSYRLIAHCATTNAVAFTIKCEVEVTPSVYVAGTPATDTSTVTMTHNWGANATLTTKRSRVADRYRYEGYIALTGAPSSATLTLTLPSGDVIDTTKLSSGAVTGFGSSLKGEMSVYAGSGWAGLPKLASSSTLTLYYADTNGNYGPVTQAAPATFANGHEIGFAFEVPIVGLSSSVQMSDSNSGRDISSEYSTGAGTALGTGVVILDFGTKVRDLCANVTTGAAWKFTADEARTYTVSGATRFTTAGRRLDLYKNGTFVKVLCEVAVDVTTCFSAKIDLIPTDYIDLRANSGSASLLYADARYNYVSVDSDGRGGGIAATDEYNMKYTITAAQNVVAGVNTIQFPVKKWDTHDSFSSNTTFQPKISGKFKIYARIVLPVTVGTSTNLFSIYVNGVAESTNLDGIGSFDGYDATFVVGDTLRLLPTDLVTIVFQNGNGTIALDVTAGANVLTIERVGNY